MATRDRPQGLERLLEALEAQTLPRTEFEVVVVDDGSREQSATAAGRRPVEEALRHPRPRGPAAARNTGWRAARARLVAFTDDDCRPEPGWLEAGLAAHAADPRALVQGLTRPEPDEEAALRHPRARSIRSERLGPFFPTCNMFYPRALLEATGGFDTAFPTPGGEDTDLALRVLATGAHAVFAPGAVVNHPVTRPSLAQAVAFAARWRGQVLLVKRHPRLRAVFPWRGRVWRESHARLLVTLVALPLAAVHPAFLLWALPYLALRHGWSPGGLSRALRELPDVLPVDLAELVVLAWASAGEGILFL